MRTGVDKGGPGGPAPPPNGRAKKELTLCLHLKDDISVTDILKISKNNLQLSALFLQKLVKKILKLLQSPVHLITHNY